MSLSTAPKLSKNLKISSALPFIRGMIIRKRICMARGFLCLASELAGSMRTGQQIKTYRPSSHSCNILDGMYGLPHPEAAKYSYALINQFSTNHATNRRIMMFPTNNDSTHPTRCPAPFDTLLSAILSDKIDEKLDELLAELFDDY